MRRSFMTALALLALVRSPALAQTCMGMASFAGAPVQLTGTSELSQLSTSLGGSLGYGLPSGAYGNLAVSRTSRDGVEGSALGLGAGAGFQLKVGQAQFCPHAGFVLGIGPNDGPTGVDVSNRSASVGLQVGTILTAAQMHIVPSVGVSYVRSKDQAKNGSGATLYEISDSYGLAQFALGVVLSPRISVRPGAEIPLGLQGGEASVGLTVGYNW
jgi:hypothetical protein